MILQRVMAGLALSVGVANPATVFGDPEGSCSLSAVPTVTEYAVSLSNGTTNNFECTTSPPAEVSKGSSVGFSNQFGTISANAGIFTFESTGQAGTSGSGTLFGYTALATVFELSGPGASVSTSLNVDYYAINEVLKGESVRGNGLIQIRYRLRNGTGSVIFDDSMEVEFGSPIGVPSEGTWTSASTNLPTDTALIMWLEVNWQVGINTQEWPTSSEFQNDGWVAFNASNVFTFGGDGYTANAPGARIVNNQWRRPPFFSNGFDGP